jgi:hypothetical protein
MLLLIFFLVQLAIIFLLARSFSQNFFRFWFLITKSSKWSINLCAFFLLPGTIIHELSHWLIAEILQVHTGDINLWPTPDENLGIKMGSVRIAHSDPFRRTIIGLAPLLTGLLIIFLATKYFPLNFDQNFNWLHSIILIFIVFIVSNTMFSSAKDMEVGFIPFFMLLILGFALWFFKIPIPDFIINPANKVLESINLAFVTVIIIDLILLIFIKTSNSLLGKILKRKIVSIKSH